MNAFVAAGAGFLLAVLWFDLMFDVQTLGGRRAGSKHPFDRGDELAEETLASIAAYYARVTTAARPMNRLIALAMAATIAAIVVEIAGGNEPGWVAWSSLALAAAPILLAGLRTVPRAVRLGERRDPPAAQSALARSIFAEHVLCACAIAGVLAVQLGFG